MILSKTHTGSEVLVLRDAVATPTGYDNSPRSDQSPICVLLVDADRLAAWDSKDRERVRAAPEVTIQVWSRE
jgi:hypothetical protein